MQRQVVTLAQRVAALTKARAHWCRQSRTGGAGQRQQGLHALETGGASWSPTPPSPKVMSSRGRVCASGSRGQRALQSSA